MASKQQHRIFTIQVKGNMPAVQATDEMLVSVVEALQSQFPKAAIEAARYDLTDSRKPLLMVPVWTKRVKANGGK